MLQFIFIILVLAGLYMGGQWFLAHPGEMAINWFGYDITIHIVVVAAALLALIVLVALLSITLWKLLTCPAYTKM